jgi:ubiquinone/menaquinone biosynthesis C-methylase UbiE
MQSCIAGGSSLRLTSGSAPRATTATRSRVGRPADVWYTPVAIANDDFSLQDIEFHRETASYYDAEVTAKYGVYHRLLLEPYLDWLAEQLGPARALDMGCGTGVVSLALAQRGFDVLGVDHSQDMLAIAEHKLTNANSRGTCRFVVGDVRNLPVANGHFACVTCQGLLHHLGQLQPCLQELVRVLRPGGFFYISEPCCEATPLGRALRKLWRLRLVRHQTTEAEKPQSVEAPISAQDLRAMLEGLGLEFDMRFVTQLSPVRAALSERLYVLAVTLVSWPWRNRRGDLVFVFGRKPETGELGVDPLPHDYRSPLYRRGRLSRPGFRGD